MHNILWQKKLKMKNLRFMKRLKCQSRVVGAYVFAGELKQAGGNYPRAFNRYNELLHPFVEANQKLGVLVNESFLVCDEVSKEIAEERSNKIMEEVKIASNMISLLDYE